MKRALGITAVLGLAGCLDELPEDVSTSETEQGSYVLMGNIFQAGTLVSFDDITNVTGINVSKVVGITACDPKALYAVERNVSQFFTTYALWFSNDGGQSWVKQATAGKSAEIACDHSQLATLDSSGTLFVAPLFNNGSIGSWTAAPTSVKVNRIQGGDGSFYGVKAVSGGFDIYVASAKSILAPLDWGSPIATVGANQVTGTGAVRTGTDNRLVGNAKAWSRRAFALETNGTISTNSQLLDGVNWWTALNSGSERYVALTAASPNLLYGIQDKAGVRHLNRIRIDETTCGDGVDNDSNGLVDGEDPACTQAIANSFCATHANGTYCADRYQPVTFLEQPNQNAAMTRCQNQIATVTPGVCVRNPNSAITNADSQPSYDALTPAEPANTGHYCNVHWPDGTWGFNWTGSTPCATLQAQKPNGVIVRAGLYSTTAANTVFAACSDGWVGPSGSAGVAPLQSVYNAVGKTTNKCIFQVSMTAIPLFSRFVDSAHEIPGRLANPFAHNAIPVELAQFNNGESGPSNGVDRFGYDVGGREAAYDLPVDEGRPVYAASNGIVITNGSRVRDINTTAFTCNGSPNQGELWIKHGVGTDATYRESFIVGYMHLRKRVVVDGQTVKAGQLLGYTGATGCTSGGFGHLHVGVARISNNNAHTDANPQLGYHFNFQATTDATGSNEDGMTSLDPLGWANFSAFDPWAYLEWNTATRYGFGKGSWSINLFKSGQAFRYP